VVLGSAVYAGQWRKEAAAFLETHEQALAKRPVWLFSSGPTGEGDPVQLMKGWRFPEALQPIADRIQPRDIAFFHGVLDTSKLSLPEKLIVKALKAPIGDFRDWEAITTWAEGIAAALQSLNQT
jgi:menaquinone-dependent protoporphyrinogen oxidase